MFNLSPRFVPLRKRRVYIPEFHPQARLEILLNQWISLYQMDTSISLDREGHSAEQIEYYNRERPTFFNKHGQELLDYLRPYEAVPENAWLLPDEGRRYEARLRLLHEAKKAETD